MSDVLDFVLPMTEASIQLTAIETTTALIYREVMRGKAATCDQSTQTDIAETFEVAAHDVEITTTVVEQPPFNCSTIPMNTPPIVLVDDMDVKAYRRMMCNWGKTVVNAKGKPLSVSKRADAQPFMMRLLVYLNRPARFVSDRWPGVRPHFNTVNDVKQFFSAERERIMDFYTFALSGVMSASNSVREVQDGTRTAFKNVMKSWEAQLHF
jgi:hypothetical protein